MICWGTTREKFETMEAAAETGAAADCHNGNGGTGKSWWDQGLWRKSLENLKRCKKLWERVHRRRCFLVVTFDGCQAHKLAPEYAQDLEARSGIFPVMLQPGITNCIQPVDCCGILRTLKSWCRREEG